MLVWMQVLVLCIEAWMLLLLMAIFHFAGPQRSVVPPPAAALPPAPAALDWDVDENIPAAPLSASSPDRPKTSRRVRHPTPSEFSDYILPSPSPRSGPPSLSQTLSFEEAPEPEPEPVSKKPHFRANRPEPLEKAATPDSPGSSDVIS